MFTFYRIKPRYIVIVIPAKARKIFNIKPGDNLVIIGDENAGLAILKEEDLLSMMQPAK
ncbi:MAG: AbrB/MazE/SpoVT family DNA-binding domain-containing protein [Lachnospiraceae bacterium]|nr:AbrB/MazE/SpoVT family DNA-binding domain-containing protein [Candidatus Hippenecus merdae]